jgi:hypothetical protein
LSNEEQYGSIMGELKLSTPAGVGPLLGSNIKLVSGVDRADVTTRDSSQEQTMGFALKDVDAGDKFVTSIYR